MEKESGWFVFVFGVILGIFIASLCYDVFNNKICIEWDTKPTQACSIYKDHFPQGCDMVSELESSYGCSVSVCAEGYECNPEVYCPEYYLCCNFEEVCTKWVNE